MAKTDYNQPPHPALFPSDGARVANVQAKNLTLSAEQFAQGGEGLEMIAEDFQRHEERDGQEGARDVPEPHPKHEREENHDGI